MAPARALTSCLFKAVVCATTWQGALDRGTEEEVRDLAAEKAATFPVYSLADKQVRDHTGRSIGSITVMRPNTTQEAISVYCRLHQCKAPCKRVASAPSERAILEWFWQGMHDCPQGKLGREEHLRMYRELLPGQSLAL